MSIKSTRYVRITSAVAGASSVAQQSLSGRRFTTSSRVPVGEIVLVTPGGAEEYFGSDSPEARFARQYFSYISPAPASQARDLQFAAYAPGGRSAQVFGEPVKATIAQIVALNGESLAMTVGGVALSVIPDLSEVATYSDVASELQAALQTVPETADATVTFDALSGAFVFDDTVIANTSISMTSNDLTNALGWAGPGVILSPGVTVQSPLDAFITAEQVSDSFGSASFDSELDEAAAIDLATYVAGANVKWQLYLSVDRDGWQDRSVALLNIASVGLILNATPDEYKEAIPAAIMAATDYDRRNATVNYMYRSAAFTADVTTDAEADALDAARVNYYGQTAMYGQRIDFFQRGYLMGGATAPLDMGVHANEQWLKSFIASRLLSLQLSVNKIPANNEGRGLIRIQVMEGVEQAKFNGTISVGKDLTAAQQIAITQITGDPLAWMDVQNQGYWLDVEIVENMGVSGIAEYTAQYTLAYSKMDVVRKIEGSHNLI